MSERVQRARKHADEVESAERGTERHIGKSIPRVDAPAKVSGQAQYAIDYHPNQTLHAKLVTSQVAHARLKSVDTSASEALSGVVAIATNDDVPDTRRGQFILDQPILAAEKVRYIGDPIAVIAAESEEIAEQAVGLVNIEYEPLEPVFDLEDAYKFDPPGVVHEDVRSYEFAVQGDPRYEKRGHVDDDDVDRPNLMYKDEKTIGDVEAAFADADFVFEDSYEVKPIQHCAMEAHVAVAESGPDGISITTSQQVPHNIEEEICMVYPDLDPSDLTITAPYVGGGFGGKITPFLETMLVAIAQKVSRPVRLKLTRAEEFTSGVSRPQVITRIRDGVMQDGTLVARDAHILFNGGAYNEQVFRCTCSGPSMVAGSYDIPNIRWQSNAVYTNLPMFAAFRGFGKPEVNWGIERHMDRTAKQLGLDPVEYRAKNLLREGDTNAKGETLGPNDTESCLRKPVEKLETIDIDSAYPEYANWKIGLGIAYGSKPVSRAASAVTVRVQSGMNIEVRAGASDIGQGSDTVLTQIAAEAFDVALEKITLVTGDTEKTPYDRGPTGSRFTYHTGNALRKAANEAKKKLFEQSVDILGDVDPATLSTKDGYVWSETGDKLYINDLFSDYGQQVGVSNTMLRDGGELIGTATYDARRGGEDHAFWTPVGQAALVAVNPLTGKTDVLKFVTACDVGRALNPQAVEQQLEGATGQGIATALYEEIVYENGQVLNPNFKDYRIPGITELPYESETIIIESGDDDGPFGGKGVGEMGMIASAPAIGNAVANALGCEFETAPITPERVIERVVEE